MAPPLSFNASTRTSSRTPKPSARKRAQSATTPIPTGRQKRRKSIPKPRLSLRTPTSPPSLVVISDVEQDKLDETEDAKEEAEEAEAEDEEAEEEEAEEETLKFMSVW
jgi:hypothetical protein